MDIFIPNIENMISTSSQDETNANSLNTYSLIFILHHMITFVKEEPEDQTLLDSLNSTKTDTVISNYFNFKTDSKKPIFSTNFVPGDATVPQNKFPIIKFGKCLLVTDKNVNSLELIGQPHIIFLKLVYQANWSACEKFCKIFDISLPNCIKINKNKILFPQIPPIKTALKLAMFSEVNA